MLNLRYTTIIKTDRNEKRRNDVSVNVVALFVFRDISFGNVDIHYSYFKRLRRKTVYNS